MRSADCYIVVCKDQGAYVLTTRQTFETKEEAERFAATCSESRAALVIPGDFRNLRFVKEAMS